MSSVSSKGTEIKKVSILGKDSIHCGFHLVPYIVQTVLETLPASAYVLVTDSNVAKFHLDKFGHEFTKQIESSARITRFITHVIPPGETSKSREGKAEIEDFMLKNACTRDTVVIAVGGGVIGDLVGFVAATLYVCPFPKWHCVLNGLQHAWRQICTSSNDFTCYGRFERRRQDRHRYPTRQEPHWCILATRVHFHRCGLPRNSPHERVLKWNGRGRKGKPTLSQLRNPNGS